MQRELNRKRHNKYKQPRFWRSNDEVEEPELVHQVREVANVVRTGEGVQRSGSGILELVEAYRIGRLKGYGKGESLYCQGDLADCVFVVKRGKVKVRVFSSSSEGKAHIYDVLGAGRLVGVTALLLGAQHDWTATALEDTDVYVIPQTGFEHLLADSRVASMAVVRELAQTLRFLARRVRVLSFLGVSQRLKHCLASLAQQHGIVAKEGITIGFGLTHQEIAEMIAANRSTVTSHLNKLRRGGLLRKESRRITVIPSDLAFRTLETEWTAELVESLLVLSGF